MAGMAASGDTASILLDDSLDADARLGQLLPPVYDQLRAAAQKMLAVERPNHTLQATALVHEAYMRLVGDRKVPWANQAHFYVAAAEAMRRILLDHARGKGCKKRGGGRVAREVSSLGELADAHEAEIVRFDDAIGRLERDSPEAAMVVRLRFYAGLSVDQTAAALATSPATVDRRWASARAWLFEHLREGAG